MKAHSDTLTREDFQTAGRGLPIWPEVTQQGSRSRARGFTFKLEGNTTRWRNSGTYGAERVPAASWDDHGHYFAVLFDRDPDAIIGPYDGREDFHRQTEGKYR